MNPSELKKAEPHIKDLAEVITTILQQSEILKKKLLEIEGDFKSRYQVNLSVKLDLLDDEKEHQMPLLTTGITACNNEFRQFWGDSPLQRYVVDGVMEVVPADHCPKCWGPWDFKILNLECLHCPATMGKDVKLLLDNSVCPRCEEGKITISHPLCSECGAEIDTSLVIWG